MPWLKNLIRGALPRPARNLLRSPGQSWRWWRNEQLGPLDYALRPDWTLRCPRNAIAASYRFQRDDPAQAAELDDFIRLVRSLPRVSLLDIGAHFGIFSLAAAHYGGKSARALALDPSGVAIKMLQRVAEMNGASSQIQWRQAAAGAGPGEMEMVETGVAGAGYMVMPQDHPAADRIRLPLATIDALASEQQHPFTVIKVDVEGFELDVLRGGSKTLSNAAIPLCLELHNEIIRSRGADPAAILHFLKAAGYHHLSVEGQPSTDEALLTLPVVRLTARK